MTTVTGYATCRDFSCEQGGVQRPIEMVETVMTQRASDLPITITETVHHHLADDGDSFCPSCGQACSLSLELPRQIPVQVGA